MARTNVEPDGTPSGRPGARAFAHPNVSTAGRLRLASLAGRSRMADLIRQAGFTDVTIAQCSAFRFEGPEGRRPTEIAARSGMSKQSVNDDLQHLEARGYLVRVPHPADGRARVVRLTDRGRDLQKAVWSAGRRVEEAWAQEIGEPEWSTFARVLDRLAASALDDD